MEDTTDIRPSGNDFETLVQDINSLLGPDLGISSPEVDIEQLKSLIGSYTSNEEDWGKFSLGDSSRGYTRNLVDYGNGKANLLILVWTPGKGSPIHDHANAHCIMKILKGNLTETRYKWPQENASSPLQLDGEETYGTNETAYIADELGLHRVHNPSLTDFAVSLHVYTPPNAAAFGCDIFDEKTGRSSHITQSNYYSIKGVKT